MSPVIRATDVTLTTLGEPRLVTLNDGTVAEVREIRTHTFGPADLHIGPPPAPPKEG